MSKTRIVLLTLLAILFLIEWRQPAPAAPATGTNFTGRIKAADGKALEGVTVSARQNGKTYSTTVFTDDSGNYVFPLLEGGSYRVWAQAVGFETARAELTVDESKESRHEFTMKPFKDFHKQLTGGAWTAALPEDTLENRRMKILFRNNCAGCHTPNFVLQNRFDEEGWKKIITVMETVGIYGEPPGADRAPFPLLRLYRDELAAYLARMRGPGPSPMKFVPQPRPRGESAQVVITEYDITSSSDLNALVTHDGSDWMEGVPSAYEARGPHDAEVDADGFVWIADSQDNPGRTVARLDPRTGEVKNFKLEGGHGMAMGSHGIVIDHKGIAWFNADGGLGKVDTKTMKVEHFEPPRNMARVGGTLDVDSSGTVCVSTSSGALLFDPATEKFTEYLSPSPGNEGRTYGVAVDAKGNCWWAQMNFDKLGITDRSTGKSGELALRERPGMRELFPEKDRKIFDFVRSDWNSAVPWAQGPRRLGADKRGNSVWVADWWGDNLAKIDINTKQVTHYQHPGSGFAGVYDTVIDKNGMVWINLMNDDKVARFDPRTEKWTEFHLPTLGTETRFIAVDNHKDPVEVWTPSWRTSKLIRIQFRTQEQLRAGR